MKKWIHKKRGMAGPDRHSGIRVYRSWPVLVGNLSS